jgi:hypothetical protein
MIKKIEGTMPWGGYSKAAPRHLTLRLDKVGWPSPPASYKYRGRTRNRGEGQNFKERQREEGETNGEEMRFWGGRQKF